MCTDLSPILAVFCYTRLLVPAQAAHPSVTSQGAADMDQHHQVCPLILDASYL